VSIVAYRDDNGWHRGGIVVKPAVGFTLPSAGLSSFGFAQDRLWTLVRRNAKRERLRTTFRSDSCVGWSASAHGGGWLRGTEVEGGVGWEIWR
jgi:hypothetical protein